MRYMTFFKRLFTDGMIQDGLLRRPCRKESDLRPFDLFDVSTRYDGAGRGVR